MVKKAVWNVKKSDFKGKHNLVICDVSAIMRTHFRSLADDGKVLKSYVGNDGQRHEFTQFVAKVWLEDGDIFNTSAMYGLLNKVMLRFGFNQDYIFAFDTPGNMLKKIDDHYKANRVKMGNEYFDQVNTFMKMMQDCGYTCLAQPGFEADHMIHEAVKQNYDYYDNIYVVTNDMDISSVINDKTTWVCTIQSRGDINMANYEERVKCPYNSILLKKCLVGDKSDEIQGVYRFGEKKFKQFMQDNVDSDDTVRGHEVEILKNSNLAPEQLEQALYASNLVLPLKVNIDAIANERDMIDYIKLKAWLNKFEMASIITELDAEMSKGLI